jgi:hypothetical protein
VFAACSFVAHAQAAPVACVPITGPPVWVTCENVASAGWSTLVGEPPVGFDLYKATAGANSYPSVLWKAGCGYRNPFCTWGQGNSDGTAAWTSLAQNGFTNSAGVNSGPVNVYIVYVNLPALGLVSTNYGVGSGNTFVVDQEGTNFWPSGGTYTGTITFVSPTNTNTETLTVTGQTGTGPWTVTTSTNNTVAHSTNDYAILGHPNAVDVLNSYAEFLAFLGHNPASATAPGNPHQLYGWGVSSGAWFDLLINQLGPLAFNAGRSNFSLADFKNAHLVRIAEVSSEADMACTAGFGQFLAISSLFGWVARATSIGETIGTACVPTGANSSYNNTLVYSATSCLPGSSTCVWGTPLLTPNPAWIMDGSADAVVSQWPDQAWVNAAPAFMLGGHTVVPGAPHGSDLFGNPTIGAMSTSSTTWINVMNFFFASKNTGSITAQGAGGGIF